MYEILMWVFVVLWVIGAITNYRKTFQVSYYETMLERYEKEVGIKLPKSYQKVKNDFFVFLK